METPQLVNTTYIKILLGEVFKFSKDHVFVTNSPKCTPAKVSLDMVSVISALYNAKQPIACEGPVFGSSNTTRLLCFLKMQGGASYNYVHVAH